MANTDPYLKSFNTAGKDQYLKNVVDNANYSSKSVNPAVTGLNRKLEPYGYDVGSLFRQLDINATGPYAEKNAQVMDMIRYMQANLIQTSSDEKMISNEDRMTNAMLISSFTGRDLQNDVLPNLDQYTKFFTGVDTDKSIPQSFKDHFEANDIQKEINNLTLLLLDIPYDDVRRPYYEDMLAQKETAYATKTADVSNGSGFWRKVASSGNIVAQSVEQIQRSLVTQMLVGGLGGLATGLMSSGVTGIEKMGNAMLVGDAMKKASAASAIGYTASTMMKGEASEIAKTLLEMVDEDGNRIPLDIIKEQAYSWGLISAFTEMADDFITPIGNLKLGNKTLGETYDAIKDLIKSNPAGYVGLGVGSTAFQAGQEGLQGYLRQRGINAAIRESNSKGFTNIPEENLKTGWNDSWNVVWDEFKESFIPMGVSQLLTGAVSAGATFTTSALSRAMQVTPQMNKDANRYFSSDKGRVFDIGFIDTVGADPVDHYAPKTDAKTGEKQEPKKASPIIMTVNAQTGAYVPVYARDRQYLEFLRTSGVTGVRGIVISEQFVNKAGNTASASNLANTLALMIGEDNPVMGYDGNAIIMETQDGVEAAAQGIKNYRAQFFGNPDAVEISKQEDGSYRIMWETESGKARSVTIRVKADTDAVVSSTQTEEGEAQTTGNVNPVRQAPTEGFGNMFSPLIHKSLEQAYEDDETEYAAKYFYSQLTGMTMDEIEKAWREDYQSIMEKLPEGVGETTIEEGARFMPLLSAVTGKSTQDLLKDPQRRIVLSYGGKAKMAQYSTGERGLIEGGFNEEYDEDSKTWTYRINLTDAAGVRATALVHELMHVARAMASPEKLSGFVGLRGYTSFGGAMWRSDIVETKDGKYRLGDQIFETRKEARNMVEANEEQFVRDFFEYLRTGNAPNTEVASFFNSLKQFLQRFRIAFSDKFSQETKEAFDRLLSGEVEVQPGQTIEEAVEASDATLTDEVPQWEANDYSDEEEESYLNPEGEMLYSIDENYDPEKTGHGYKLFEQAVDTGELYPLFIGKNEPTKVGVWNIAENIPTKGFANRPGWHIGSTYPLAVWLLGRNGLYNSQRGTNFRRVWCEVSYPMDVDYQSELDERGIKDIKDHTPENGYYRFREANGEWIISGALRIDKVMTDADVKAVLEEQGVDYNTMARDQIRKHFKTELPEDYSLYSLSPDRDYRQVSFDDFHMATEGTWEYVERNSEAEKKISKKPYDFRSSSGSTYWYDRENNTVYRMSDHWGRVASCVWELDTDEYAPGRSMLGKINLNDLSRIIQHNKYYGDYFVGRENGSSYIYPIDENGHIKQSDSLYSLQDDRQWQVMDANTQRRIDADYDYVRNQFFGTDKWMKAPNGQPTKLTERQWVQVRTPAFKQWFGDWENDPENSSKILDGNGEPKAVFHGTMEKFDTFEKTSDIGYHFGTLAQAEEAQAIQYSSQYWLYDTEDGEPEAPILQCFLNIRKPITGIEDEGLWTGDNKAFTDQLNEKGFLFDSDSLNRNAADWWQKKISQTEAIKRTLIEEGYDGIIYNNRFEGTRLQDGEWVGDDSYIAFKPNQIKSATDNVGTFSNENDNTLYSLSDPMENENFRRWFGDSKVIDENGKPLVVYHGTSRGDRVGEVFDPSRATSGPMAFFTTDRGVAEGYTNKRDTSMAYEPKYESFQSRHRFSPNGEGWDSPISRAWFGLSERVRQEIIERAKHVTSDGDTGQIIYDEKATRGLGNFDDYLLREHRGNAISALIDSWLESGELFREDESRFDEVLNLAGITDAIKERYNSDIRYYDPYTTQEKVFEVYLSIQNPFDTARMVTEQFVTRLENWFKRQPKWKYSRESMDTDAWDKHSIEIEKFAERLRSDIEEGTTLAWTSIPDFVTDYLKYKGFDGIRDMGGKFHDIGHTVWIPFYSNQVKSATDNSGGFSTENDSILYSLSAEDNNRIVDDFVAQYPDTDVADLDGVKYIKHSNDTYTDDELRTIKDSVSETLHSLRLQPELNFAGQLELDFSGNQDYGQTGQMGRGGNAGGETGAPAADLRGLRPGVAKYFDWTRGWSGKEPSTAIDSQWDKLGYISFINTEIRTPEDFAKLYSVYRNPKLEYAHVIFMKGNTVAAHLALSTGIPNSAYAVPLGGVRYLRDYMARVGADGYYLMHNHPSGDVDFSPDDKKLTLNYIVHLAGFKGHIILDHNKFGFFDEKMKFSIKSVEGMHEASEEKMTSGFKETYGDLEKSFGAIYTRSQNEPTFSIFYMDYRGKLVDIEDRKDIPSRDYLNDRMKKGFHSYAVAFTNDKEMFEEMRKAAVFATPKYNFEYVLLVDPTDPTFVRWFGEGQYFNDNVWGYVKGTKRKTNEAIIPKFQHNDDTGTLYSLSPERKAQVLEERKREIERAVGAGIFVSTEYLNEFRGEDWVQAELDLRDWMIENPDVVALARNSDTVDEFKKKYLGKPVQDNDDISFDESGLFDDDEIPFTEPEDEETEQTDAPSDTWFEKIYQYAHALSSADRDRQFAAEWTATEDKTLELANTLRSYMDAFFNAKPNSRKGGYWYTRTVYGAFKGVSQKVRMLRDGKSRKSYQRERSSSEEIREAQELIRQNPRPYRNAYMTAMMAESRAAQVRAGEQTGIGEDADWMRLEMIDDDIAQEMEKLESESTAAKKPKTDYSTKYEDLKKKLRDAERDLQKANENSRTTIGNLRSQLDLANAKVDALQKQLREDEADLQNAEKEYSDLIERLGGKIEDLQEDNAELRAEKSRARKLEKQLEERRNRVKELRSDLTAANRETRRLQNALDASRRYIEARKASEYRNKRLRQIRNLATFNPDTQDASFEESFDWVLGLFIRDEGDMEIRKDLDSRIAALKARIEQSRYSGENVDAQKQELLELRKQKRQSRMLEAPAQLALYLPQGYEVRADNRPSMWSAEELDILLRAVQLMRMDAKAMLADKKAARDSFLNSVAYKYFRQASGREGQLNEYGEMSSRALIEDILSQPEKTFGKGKEKILSYHLYKAKIQRLARIVDGYSEGVVYDWFVRRSYRNQTKELSEVNRRLALGDKVWKELGLKHGELAREGFQGKKENGTKYSLTRGQMIGVYIYSKSELGYEKLTSISGNGITEGDVKNISNALTDKERAWAEFLLSEMDGNWQRLADTYYLVWNRNLGRREAYFPLVSAVALHSEDTDFLCGENINSKDGKSYVDKGFTKEVNPNAIYPLNLDATATWNKQVRRQEHFVAYGEWARDTQRLLDGGRGMLGAEIKQIYGEPYYRNIQRQADHVISNYITTGTGFDTVFGKYFSARNAAALTASFSTMFKQLGSIGAIFETGADFSKIFSGEKFFRNFLLANEELNSEFGEVGNVREFIYQNAPDIRNRKIDHEVMAYMNRVYGGAVSNAIQKVTGKVMEYTTNACDRLVVERLWLAKYYTEFENLREQGQSVRKAHEEAVFKASQLISETQPTSMRMDQSGMQIEAQKNSLLRMIAVFTNQAMNLSNMIMSDWNYARKNRDWKKLVRVTAAVAVNVGFVALVSGRFVKKGDEDDDKYAMRLVREILATIASTFDPVFGGNLASGILYGSQGQDYLAEFNDIGEAVRKMLTPSDRKTAWERISAAMEAIASEAAGAAGIPAGNVLKRPIQAVTEKNPGYLINSNWGQIVESYR